MSKRVVILGAGIFGCEIAINFDRIGYDVLLLEKNESILSKASRFNQNRVHLGFHYPRSSETASQAIRAFDQFTSKYSNAIRDDNDSYYCISSEASNVSFDEYLKFCDSLNLKYELVESNTLHGCLNLDKVSSQILRTNEKVFDVEIIRQQILRELRYSNVTVKYNSYVERILKGEVNYVKLASGKTHEAEIIINCTYSDINRVLYGDSEQMNLKYQNVLLPIVKSDSFIPSLTIMDGPFCSVLPKGLSSNDYIVSNVKYSVLQESKELCNLEPLSSFDHKQIARLIIETSADFIPILHKTSIVDYWAVRKALPVDAKDSRLTKVDKINGADIFSVLQGKISTSELVFDEILMLLNENKKK